LSHIRTDLGVRDILGLLPDIISIVGNKKCKNLEIPAAGEYEEIFVSGAQALEIDIGASREVLRKILE
jgi:hypothetical protein